MRHPAISQVRGRLLCSVLVACAALAPVLGTAGGTRAAPLADCSRTQTGMVPLTQLGAEGYKGQPGGLYPGGGNAPPAAQADLARAASALVVPRDAAGQPDPAGRVGLLSIGMSNATQEFQRFMTLAAAAPGLSPRLRIVDGAQGGQTAAVIRNPAANFWAVVDQRLGQAGVSAAQVQAVWIKEANAQPRDAFPVHAQALADDLKAVIGILQGRFPNLKLAYLSSRIYAGYASTTLNPEPFAYEGAFAVRWLIERQMAGEAGLIADPAHGPVTSPVLLWGPYLWADGLTPRDGDGLTWACADLGSDGTHPSESGRTKVGRMLLDFLRADETSRPWFMADPDATPPPSATAGSPAPTPTGGTARPIVTPTSGAVSDWRVHETPSGDEMTVRTADAMLQDRLRQLGAGRMAWLCGRVQADPVIEWGFTYAATGLQLVRTPPPANQSTIRTISADPAAAPQPACIQLDAARELGEDPTAIATATGTPTPTKTASATRLPIFHTLSQAFLPMVKAEYKLEGPPKPSATTTPESSERTRSVPRPTRPPSEAPTPRAGPPWPTP